MNKNFPLETRHNTLKMYRENYENDLKAYLESYEDNTKIDFLEIDLISHKGFLKYLLTKTPVTNDIDEGSLNQRKINSQKRIIDFINNKIAIENKNFTEPDSMSKVKHSTLNWQGTPLEFAELTKALIQSNKLNEELTQTEIFNRLKLFFNVEDFKENDKLKDIRKRTNTLTPFINVLETSLTNWIKNKD
jgi:hypothetical protein